MAPTAYTGGKPAFFRQMSEPNACAAGPCEPFVTFDDTAAAKRKFAARSSL